MGDFIIIALIVSSFWLLWEILRIVRLEHFEREEITVPSGEIGREELFRCADSFEQLAELFRSMLRAEEDLSEEDIKQVLSQVQNHVCCDCPEAMQCWGMGSEIGISRFYTILERTMQGKEVSDGRKAISAQVCAKDREFQNAVVDNFGKARLNLLWRNRLTESRSAAADQLLETAGIIRKAASHIYDVERVDGMIRQQADVRLRMHGILLKDIWCVRQRKGMHLYVTLRTYRKGRCICAKEAAALLSAAFGVRLIPDEQGKTIINSEYRTLLFLTEPQYYMVGGAARAARDGEVVSGDNFSLFSRENGQMIMSISDGMGSGITACKESETVIDLLEQFLGSGFEKEAAIRLIHTSMLLQTEGEISATVDLCMTDLYSGECEFLKIGASTTFLKRRNWVETIASTSMPMGILRQADYECTKKKLEEGDCIIMVSDGVMDAFPQLEAEERIKDYLLESEIENAKDLARSLLQYVIGINGQCPKDDMTVLVGALRRR